DHQAAQAAVGADRNDQLVEGNRIDVQVVAIEERLEALIENEDRPRLQVTDVLRRRLRIHGDHDVGVGAARGPAVLVGPDGEPGGQALNVRGENILSAHGHAHLKEGAHQDQVGRLAAGAVGGGHGDDTVIHDCAVGG